MSNPISISQTSLPNSQTSSRNGQPPLPTSQPPLPTSQPPLPLGPPPPLPPPPLPPPQIQTTRHFMQNNMLPSSFGRKNRYERYEKNAYRGFATPNRSNKKRAISINGPYFKPSFLEDPWNNLMEPTGSSPVSRANMKGKRFPFFKDSFLIDPWLSLCT